MKVIDKIGKMLGSPFMKKVEPRMYVIVREDLAFKYIQGAHALAEFALRFPSTFGLWHNETIVFLSVFNQIKLEAVCRKLNNLPADEFIRFRVFHEPDLGDNAMTAIAVYEEGTGVVRKALEHLPLATK